MIQIKILESRACLQKKNITGVNKIDKTTSRSTKATFLKTFPKQNVCPNKKNIALKNKVLRRQKDT